MAEKRAVSHLPVAWLQPGLESQEKEKGQVKGDFQRSFQSIRSLAERMSLVHCKTKHRHVAELNLAEMPLMFVAF